MARFNDAKMNMATDTAFQTRYNYLIDLLDRGYSTEKLIAGKIAKIDINPDDGFKISYDGTQIFGIDATTGEIVIGKYDDEIDDINDDAVFKDTDYAGIQISAVDGFISAATIGGKSVSVQLNATDGLGFYDGATYRGGMTIRDGDLTLLTDVLGTVSDENHFVKFGEHALYGGSDDYSLLKFFASDEAATPAPIETLRIASKYWAATDTAQTFIGIGTNGTTVKGADVWLSASMCLETPIGSAYLHLSEDDVGDEAGVSLLATNPSENSSGFQIYANPSTPKIDVMVDYTNIGQWLSNGLKINGNYVWHTGNDGSGSGLDADKLDGNHASAFSTLGHTHETINVVDIRTVGDGDSYFETLPSDMPDKKVSAHFGYLTGAGSSWRGILTVKGWSGTYGAWQLIGVATTSADDDLYFRSGAGSSWRSPVKIWHAGNDGSGSGLDADKLDGWHSDNFYLRTRFDSGSVTLGTASWTSVSFGHTFSSTPKVVISANTSTSGAISPKVKSVTTTGFDATIGGSGYSGINCDWIAIQTA